MTDHGKIRGVESTTFLTKTKSLFSKLPLKVWIIGGALFTVVLSYSVIFFIPKQATFSYAAQNCVSQLVLAPDTQRITSDSFTGRFEKTVRLGAINLFSTEVCLDPIAAPKEGVSTVRIAPFGGWLASKQLTVSIPEAPIARSSDVIGKPISTSVPLTIQLTSEDVIHQYRLSVEDKMAKCAQENATLSCDVESLNLAHGASYTASLYQSYKATNKKIIEGTIETLQPLVMTGSSIVNDQTVFDKPSSVDFTFDQIVKEGDISLLKITGESEEKVPLTQQVSGQTLKVLFPELAREATYRLTVTQAIGENGSSLAVPASLTFKTSGGPKVAGVSVGAHSVARNAAILITFDQPLDASVDVVKSARIEGLSGTVKKQSDTQLVMTIQGGDCTAFRLVIDKGIKSGSNGEASKDDWVFSSRTICGTSWTIGKSVQGRPIVAYSFGSGATTILFTAGIHGSEPSSTSTMQAFVQHLQAYGDMVPADKRVVIVPNVNPDGIARGSRYNVNNVNLGRNFPTANWSSSIETASGTLPNGGGSSPGSEPETAALIALTRQLKPRLEVSFHAQGKLVGANKFADSVAIGNIYSSTVGYKTMYYNAEEVMGYAMTGEYEDWMGEEMNIPAILIELPSAYGNYLSSQMAALKKMLSI